MVFRGEVWARDLNLGVISIGTGIYIVRLNDITKGASRYGEEVLE